MNNIIWKDIPGYEGRYQASTTGEIRSLLPRFEYRLLRSAKCHKGYFYVALKKSGKSKSIRVHRLVAITFIDNLNPRVFDQINHINGIKTDNRVENLEWSNNSKNQIHAYENNLRKKPKGSTNGNSKLKEYEVLEMRRLYSSGHIPRTKDGKSYLASMFKVSVGCLNKIVYNANWSHV